LRTTTSDKVVERTKWSIFVRARQTSFMAALEAAWLGGLLEQHNLVLPFVLLASSYALGALAWIGVDIRKPLAEAVKPQPEEMH
jgi:hypothetical protein